jgi:hypothetical protein
LQKHHENVAQVNPVHHFPTWKFDKIFFAEAQQSEQQLERPHHQKTSEPQ